MAKTEVVTCDRCAANCSGGWHEVFVREVKKVGDDVQPIDKMGETDLCDVCYAELLEWM